MSKMSQLHAELSEQAYKLGFETIQDAVNSGYVVDYDKGKLVRYGLGYSETVEYLVKEQEKAHEEWLKKRKEVIESLNDLYNELAYIGIDDEYLDTVGDTIDFIKQGEL